MSILIDDGNSQDETIVKCDIGEFVITYERVKKLLSPVFNVLKYSQSVLK